MTATDYAKIRRELEQLRQETPKKDRKNAIYDFGLFILLYFFALVLVVTAMLAIGVTIGRYTCLYAVPLAWLGLAWFRKAPLYALLISVAGVLFLAACSVFVSQFFDIAWDSNCYHKPDTGLLAYGWNPFQQTMTSYANSTSYLPYNSGWLSYQVDNQPKASFIIGASLYAFWGNITYGKVFNIASIVACICIVTPMVRDAFKLNSFAAFAAVLFASVNPITLSQALSYYNDGFVYQLITITAASLCYLAYRPEGRYAKMAKVTVFAAVCLAVNVKTSAVLFCTVICVFYYIARVIAIAQSDDEPDMRKKRQWRLFLYFLSIVLCGVCVLGATTYMVNLVRFGNPFYGMLGQSSINELLESLMSTRINSLPLFVQFFVSLFSPMSNTLFTDINLKLPFIVSASEWNVSALDTNINGWGFLFSGIFLASLVVIIRTALQKYRRRSRKVKFLIVILLAVFLPVFFIPYLFSARYYPQPFWLPMTAMVCLFAPVTDKQVRLKQARGGGRTAARLIGIVLCLLLIINCVPAYRYLSMQIETTKTSRAAIETIKEDIESGEVMDVTTASPGMFFGLFFNLRDEGIEDYNFTEHITDIQGTVLYYLAYNMRSGGSEEYRDANSFLYSLNSNGYLVVIARQGGGPLTSQMLLLLEAMALLPEDYNAGGDTYLTVIDTDAHIRAEAGGQQAVSEQLTADGLDVQVQSAADGASIVIDGTEYALGRDGYNIVVYDPKNMTLVDSAVIDTNVSPALSR